MYFKICFQLLSNTPSKQYHSSLLPVVNECLCFSLPASIEEFGCWQMLKYLSNCYLKMVSYYFKLHFLSMRLSNLIIYSHFYFFFLFQLLMYFFWFFFPCWLVETLHLIISHLAHLLQIFSPTLSLVCFFFACFIVYIRPQRNLRFLHTLIGIFYYDFYIYLFRQVFLCQRLSIYKCRYIFI